MNILLDTCVILYAALEKHKLSKVAKELINNPESQLFLSSISAFEIILKYKLGKLKIDNNPIEFIKECRENFGVSELPVMEQEIYHVWRLPLLHRDPFDKIILSQAIANNFLLLTPDGNMHNYSAAKVAW